ncbi:Uncharacterised protein [Streptococcus pneumoniae]|nr:Uncharacterised protein [Streptococcus pneumoniae]
MSIRLCSYGVTAETEVVAATVPAATNPTIKIVFLAFLFETKKYAAPDNDTIPRTAKIVVEDDPVCGKVSPNGHFPLSNS